MILEKDDAIPQGRIHLTKGAMQDPLYEIMTSGDSTKLFCIALKKHTLHLHTGTLRKKAGELIAYL
jgi:hypothetical protein